MDNKAVRKANVAMLAQAAGGPTEFGKIVDRDQVQVSQWLGSKPIGDRLARHIEESLGKPKGWLDVLQTDPKSDAESQQRRASHDARLAPRTLAVAAGALTRFLARRDMTLDITNESDAELVLAAAAEWEASRSDKDADTAFVIALGDLVQAYEAKRDGRRGEPAHGAAGKQVRRKVSR